MKKLRLLVCCIALGAVPSAAPTPDAVPSAELELHAWIAEVEDNICGIATLKRVSKPAVVDYERLLAATPQVKKIEEEGIDPDSVEGQALRKGAQRQITKTCETVREAAGHCSIWKSIQHRDGRAIPDVTEDVLERL